MSRMLLAVLPVLFFVASSAPSAAVEAGSFSRGQDSLAEARDLYTTAAYEEALAMLDRLRAATQTAAEAQSIDQYRAFCLVALGRTVDAELVIERLTAVDPLWALPDDEAPPRIAALFSSVRARAMPGVLRERLEAARALYEEKKYAEAEAAFTALIALLGHPAVSQVRGTDTASLETIASGFRDLAAAAHTQAREEQAKAEKTEKTEAATSTTGVPAADVTGERAASSAPAAEPGSNGSSSPSEETSPPGEPTGTSAQVPPVSPPEIVSQQIPRPTSLAVPLGGAATIVLDVLIDELGRVERASIRQSVNRMYEAQLLSAARQWRYTPAIQAGKPVKYLKTLEITINPR